MDNENLQKRIELLEKQMKTLNNSSTISYQVDNSFVGRGFVRQDKFFFAGTGTIGVMGDFRYAIAGATAQSIVLVTTFPGSSSEVTAEMVRGYSQNIFGASSSQFDITNPAGTTFRYTWDGTGTNPNINATTLPVGSRIVIFAEFFNPANNNAAVRPYFIVTGSGANYFEVDNTTPGVAENNVTIGTGEIAGGPQDNSYELFAEGTAGDEFAYVVFFFNNINI